jgi:hypothetical protein
VTNDDEPVLNWYQHVFAAATRLSPPQAHEMRMPACADATFDRRKGVGSDPVGSAPRLNSSGGQPTAGVALRPECRH